MSRPSDRLANAFHDIGEVGPALIEASEAVGSSPPSDGGSFFLAAVAARVVGPVLTAFVLWAADQAARFNDAQLMFIARDGQLPYRLASQLRWTGSPPALSYLHGNRRAWALPGAVSLGVERWLEMGTVSDAPFLAHGRDWLPLSTLLARAGIELEDIPAAHPLATADPGESLSPELAESWIAFLHEPEVISALERRGRRQRDLLAEYLGQMGVLDRPTAFVDVGWTGQTSQLQSAVIAALGGPDPLHLHLGGTHDLVDDRPVDDRAVEIRRFAFDGASRPPFDDVVGCVETMTSSGGERAARFERNGNGEVAPVLSDGSALVANESRATMWQTAEAVAAAYQGPAGILADGEGDALAMASHQLLSGFWLEPTREEALAFTDLNFEIDDITGEASPVVGPYRVHELLRRRSNVVSRQWRRGSLQLTAEPLRSALALVERRRSPNR